MDLSCDFLKQKLTLGSDLLFDCIKFGLLLFFFLSHLRDGRSEIGLGHRVVLHHGYATSRGRHRSAAWIHTLTVIDELDIRVVPEWLSLLNRKEGSFLGTLNILKLHCGSLLLRVSIDSHHVAEVLEERVDFHVVKLVLRYIFDIDRISAGIDNAS